MKETNFSEYKNFMDEDFITYLSNYYLINVLHRYGHTSRRGTGGKTFFATEVDHDVVSNFVTYKLRKKFGVNQFNRIYINLQFNGMGGDWHLDDGKKTYMLMVTPTLKKDSGCFEICDTLTPEPPTEKTKIHKVAFEQNKLVIFTAKLWHRGRSPLEVNTPRITLALKSI
jgi:hypothetical protein